VEDLGEGLHRPVRADAVRGPGERRHLGLPTADACGLPVVAGPTEAAALGPVLVQARTHGLTGDRADGMRSLPARTQRLTRYEPRGDAAAWRAAEARLAAATR
jgi:rhamnulokinase